jgi:hypothetical protein
MVFPKSGETDINFQSGPKNIDFFMGVAPARIYLPQKARMERLNFCP